MQSGSVVQQLLLNGKNHLFSVTFQLNTLNIKKLKKPRKHTIRGFLLVYLGNSDGKYFQILHQFN